MPRKSSAANLNKATAPNSPLVHKLRSGKTWANKYAQDIRKFLVASTGTIQDGSSASSRDFFHSEIISLASSSSQSQTIREEKAQAPAKNGSNPQNNKRGTNHFEPESIVIEDDSSTDLIYIGTTSSPPKAAKPAFSSQETVKSEETKQPPSTPEKLKPVSSFKAESETPTKSPPNPGKKMTARQPKKSSSSSRAKEVVSALGVSTRSRKASESLASLPPHAKSASPRSAVFLEPEKKQISPPPVPAQNSAQKTEPSSSENLDQKNLAQNVFEIPNAPDEKASSSNLVENLVEKVSEQPKLPEIDLPTSSSFEVTLVPGPVKTMNHCKNVPSKRKLKRLQHVAKKPEKLSIARKPKTGFDYLRMYSTSKFALTKRNLPPIDEILQSFSSSKGNNRLPKSLFDLALAKFFQETIVKNWPKSRSLFSNKVSVEILPKFVKLSPMIRKKPSCAVQVVKLLVLIAADRRGNVHLLKAIASFLSNLIGIGQGPTLHALVERKLSRQLPGLLRLFRVDWQGVLRLVKCLFFKDKLALRQTGCFVLFDRLKTLVRPKSGANFLDDSLEGSNKVRLSHLVRLLTTDPEKNFVELEPHSRAFGIVRILRCFLTHFDLTRDYEDEEMDRFFQAIKFCRNSNKQTIRGYAESSKISSETQPIADEWEDLYEIVSEWAIVSNTRSFMAGGYESAVSASRTPLGVEQRRVFVVYESDPEDEESEDEEDSSDSFEGDDLEVSKAFSDSNLDDSVFANKGKPKSYVALPTGGRTSTAKKKVTIDPTIPFSPVTQASDDSRGSFFSPAMKPKTTTPQRNNQTRPGAASPDENNNLPAI